MSAWSSLRLRPLLDTPTSFCYVSTLQFFPLTVNNQHTIAMADGDIELTQLSRPTINDHTDSSLGGTRPSEDTSSDATGDAGGQEQTGLLQDPSGPTQDTESGSRVVNNSSTLHRLLRDAAASTGQSIHSVPWGRVVTMLVPIASVMMWNQRHSSTELWVDSALEGGSAVFCLDLSATQTPFERGSWFSSQKSAQDDGFRDSVGYLRFFQGTSFEADVPIKLYQSWGGYIGCKEVQHKDESPAETIWVYLGDSKQDTDVSLSADRVILNAKCQVNIGSLPTGEYSLLRDNGDHTITVASQIQVCDPKLIFPDRPFS